MSGIRYVSGGMFELLVDQFDGALIQEGLETSAAEQTLIPDSMLLSATNVLLDLNGIARKRGGLADGATGRSNLMTASTDGMAAAPRSNYGAGSAGPYLHWVLASAGTRTSVYTQVASNDAVSSVNTTLGAPTSYIPFIDPGMFVFCGDDNKYTDALGSSGRTLPHPAALIGCNDGTSYSTGTVTYTANSPIITGSGTSWTSVLEGAFFYPPSGSEGTGYYRPYLIRKVNSSTELVLAEPYRGTLSGGGLSYSIAPWLGLETGRRTTSPWGSSTTAFPVAMFAFEAWNRLVVANIREPRSIAESPSEKAARTHPTRIRWSGIIGSEEGYDPNATASSTNNRAIVGVHAWSLNGYLDFPSRFGDLIAGTQFRDSVVVWQETGMTVLFGQPTYDTAGSLDATTVYEDIRINGGWAYVVTPYGIFFIDSRQGAMTYNGGGPPKKLAMGTSLMNAIKECTHIGYFDDHLVFSYSSPSDNPTGATTLVMYQYHIPTGRWSVIANGNLTCSITHFQRSRDHECCFLVVGDQFNGSGQVSIGTMDYVTQPPGSGGSMGDFPDVGGAQPGINFDFEITSKAFGARGVKHRVEELWVTHTGLLKVYSYYDSVGTVSGGPLTLDDPSGNEIVVTNGGEVTNGQQASAVVLKVSDYGLSTQGVCDVTQIIAKGQAEGWVPTDNE